jgi:hypothetical protein
VKAGQAIVGNVTQATGEPALEKAATVTPALTDAREPAMTIIGKLDRAPVALRRKQKDDESSSA